MTDQTHTVSHPDGHGPDAHTGHYAFGGIPQDPARPGTYKPSLSAGSWRSEDENLSPRTSKYFSDLLTPYGSEVIEVPTGNNASLLTKEHQRASTVTVFPGCANFALKEYDADLTQHNPLQDEGKPTDSRSFLRKHYERAKQACRDGPPGEVDLFWAGVRNYLEARKKAVAISEIQARKPTNDAKISGLRESDIEQQAACRPFREPFTMTDTFMHIDRPKKRQDSAVSYGDISRTSREVPIKLHRTVLDVDINKPLPPSPPLRAVPRPRRQIAKGRVLDVNKPLPRTPLPCLSQRSHPSYKIADESPVDPPWPVGPTSPNRQFEVSQQNSLPQDGRSKEESMQARPLAKPPPIDGKSKPVKADKAHDAFKAKISWPIPIPPAVHESPSYIAPSPGNTSEKAQGKQKSSPSPNWRDKLPHPAMLILPAIPMGHKGKKRPESDKSFRCQGVSDAEMYAIYMNDGGPSVQDEGPRMRGEELIPVPLFTGTDAGGAGRFDEGYCGIEDTEFKRTGRWI